MAEKGKSRRIMADLLVFTLDKTAKFFEGLPDLFPQLGEIKVKSLSFDHHEHSEHCDCHTVNKAVTYTGPQASAIQELFRQNFPKVWPILNSRALDYVDSIMSGNTPKTDSPMGKAYWDMITQGSKFAFDTVTADKNKPKGMPIIPYVIDKGDAFVKKIYVDGYTLVRSQTTLNVLPQIMDTMNKALSGGLSWDQASLQISIQANIAEYEAERIVRSEMAMAANAGTVAGAKALNEPSAVIKWSTSMSGKACDICLGRNGQLYELDSPEATEIAHPNCMCVKVVTFRKRVREDLSKPTPEPAPVPQPSKPVGAPNTGKGKARITGKHELGQREIDRLEAHATAKLKEYGINGDIEVEFFEGKTNGGHVKLPIGDGSTPISKMYISSKYTYGDIKYQDIISHELKHVEQINSGKFYQKPNGDFMWDGKKQLSKAEFTRTINKMSGKTAKSKAESEAAYQKYKSWPWEAEAYATEGK